MKLPTWVYKGGVFNTPSPRLVSDPKEVLLALEEGYWSHRYKKEEIPGLFKSEIAQAVQKEKEEQVFERFVEVKKEPIETSDEEMENYKEETGKDAIWETGPRKGKLTKDFLEWRKNADK